jgi:hypothetical protein
MKTIIIKIGKIKINRRHCWTDINSYSFVRIENMESNAL